MNNMLRKRLLLMVILLVVVLVFYVSFAKIRNHNTGVVGIIVAPSSATITIDSKLINKSSARLKTGPHSLKITLDNFKPVTRSFIVNKGGDNTIRIVLETENKQGKQYLLDHPDFQTQREAVAADQVNKKSVAVTDKYPFIANLPLERQRFTINYGDTRLTKKGANPDEPYIALYVSVTDPTEKRNAIKTISDELGVGPADIEIIFDDYFNPFQKGVYGE